MSCENSASSGMCRAVSSTANDAQMTKVYWKICSRAFMHMMIVMTLGSHHLLTQLSSQSNFKCTWLVGPALCGKKRFWTIQVAFYYSVEIRNASWAMLLLCCLNCHRCTTFHSSWCQAKTSSATCQRWGRKPFTVRIKRGTRNPPRHLFDFEFNYSSAAWICWINNKSHCGHVCIDANIRILPFKTAYLN